MLRKFGFEFELFHPTKRSFVAMTEVARAITLLTGDEAVLENYSGRRYDKWQAKPDGSTSGGAGAWELVTPTMQPTQANFDKVRKVLEYLTTNGYDVNSSCGLHVNLDAADLTAFEGAAVALRYEANWDRFIQVLPVSRHGGPSSFNQRLTQSELAKVERAVRPGTTASWGHHERRVAVNLEHIAKGRGARRLEFRHHSGTINFEKVMGWYTLLCEFIATTVQTVRDWQGAPASTLPAVAVAPVVRRQRRRPAAQTVSHVVATAAPRVPYIEAGSDYEKFLDIITLNGVITMDDARSFGWPIDDNANGVASCTRLRVTAHWLRRNGAALITSHRNGELAYVTANGARTLPEIFVNEAQVRRRVTVGSAQQIAAPATFTPMTAPATPATTLIAKLKAMDALEGVSETTKQWFETRRLAFARRP